MFGFIKELDSYFLMVMTKKDKSLILLIASSIIVIWLLFSLISSLLAQVVFYKKDTLRAIAGNSKEMQWLNLSGNIKTKDLKNRIILLDFWTYACVNCLHMIPEIKKLEE